MQEPASGRSVLREASLKRTVEDAGPYKIMHMTEPLLYALRQNKDHSSVSSAVVSMGAAAAAFLVALM